jgi:hypothetical protein
MNHGLSTGCQCPVMHNVFSYYSGGDSGGRECAKNAGRHNSEHVLLAPPVPGVIESEVSTGVIRCKMMPLLGSDCGRRHEETVGAVAALAGYPD